MRPALLLLLACSSAAFAQDERRVTSPDGQLEFRIFIAEQSDTSLSRIAYQVWSKGKCVVETSYMGLDIWEQEPLLGENEGLIGSVPEKHENYNSLLAKYMQNGSTGRSIDVEIRAFNAGVAFRYIVPRSNMLEHVYLTDETTEFEVKDPSLTLTEVPRLGFPPMRVVKEEDGVRRVRLAHKYVGDAPFACPWRIIVADPSGQQTIASNLPR